MVTHETFGRWSFVPCASSRQYGYWVFIRSVIGRAITCICAWCLFTWSLSFTRILWRYVRIDRRLAWSHYGWQIFHMSRHSVDRYMSTVICAVVIPATRPTLYFVVHRPCGAFTHTRSPGLKTACCWLCVGAGCSIDSFQPYWPVL